jgi:hypothetical protein
MSAGLGAHQGPLVMCSAMSDDRCPYCCKAVHFVEQTAVSPSVGREYYSLKFCARQDRDNEYEVHFYMCPGCRKTHVRAFRPGDSFSAMPSLTLPHQFTSAEVGPPTESEPTPPHTFLLWPRTSGRAPADSTVPQDLAEDYNEACAVLSISPQSCAALARRILQRLLVEKAGANKDATLYAQIESATSTLPKYLAENLHYLRGVGNFAAHAQQSIAGTIVKVDHEEAEAALDVIEALFEHYYTSPAKSAKIRAKFKTEKVEPTGNTHLANKIPD